MPGRRGVARSPKGYKAPIGPTGHRWYGRTVLVMTEELGQPVVDADGRVLGRAAELVVRADDPLARVIRIGVRRHRRALRWVDWSDVADFERSGIQLRAGGVANVSADDADARTELWLRRDVLDTQILDAEGQRLVRVGDVVLVRVEHDLRVLAVQFGGGPVARRLGLDSLAGRLKTLSVDWHDLHLVSARGLAAQLEARSHRLDTLSHAQLAALVAQMSAASASDVLGAVGPHRAAAALRLTHPDVRARVVGALPHPFAVEVLERMPSDDATATLRGVSRSRQDLLLGHVTSARAEELRRLLAAPPDTAQGLMSTDVRLAGPGDTLEQIRDALIARPPRVGGLANVFVVDELGRPLGMIDTVAIITGAGALQPVPSIAADTPIDDVIDLFATHDFPALPVVDAAGRVIGAIAVDDVLEELVAERMPGRSRFRHYVGRHRFGRGRSRRSWRSRS